MKTELFYFFKLVLLNFVVIMPRHKYSATGKPAIDINALVAAIKEVTIEKKGLRSVGRAYNIASTNFVRYISKLKMANVDPSTASNKKLVEFISTLSSKTGAKTVCCFILTSFFPKFCS